jgi:hypothetical protein
VSHVEIETTLAICTESPDEFVRELASLPEIGGYRLMHQADRAIRDVYLDLPERGLRDRGFGLRLRVVDGEPFITLKGKLEEVAAGARSREEIELPWSQDAINAVAARIGELGLRIAPPSASLHWNDPLALLAEMGLVETQKRETRRRPRLVKGPGESSLSPAELVIDSVVYQLSSCHVRHHEIEVEMMGSGTVALIQEITAALASRWPAKLRYWQLGKRATGGMVEKLLAEHRPEDIISESGDLLPVAYDLIEAHR